MAVAETEICCSVWILRRHAAIGNCISTVIEVIGTRVDHTTLILVNVHIAPDPCTNCPHREKSTHWQVFLFSHHHCGTTGPDLGIYPISHGSHGHWMAVPAQFGYCAMMWGGVKGITDQILATSVASYRSAGQGQTSCISSPAFRNPHSVAM